MPLHDWSTQDEETFHDFRLCWASQLTAALNVDVLPDHLFARCEPVTADRSETAIERHPLAVDGCLLEAAKHPPRTDVSIAFEPPKRPRRVAVRRRGGDLVAAIEFASYSNLKSAARRQRFAETCMSLVAGGVHVCVLNVHALRGWTPSPEFIVAADLSADSEYEERPTDAAAMTTFRSGPDGRLRNLYADHPRPGDPLRPLPCFVDARAYAPLPLEETYMRTFRGLPKFVREQLAATV